ncbi:MAG: O-antigen ligase family protein [Acidimicrobiia bacterium]
MTTARLSSPPVPLVDTGHHLSGPGRSIINPTRIPAIALGVLLAGYMLGDKGFAYLHLPGTPLFVGEVALAIIVVYLICFYPISDDRLRSPARLTLVVFLLYSAFRTLPYLGEYGIDALRDASQWYYGIFAFFVADFVRRRGIAPIVGWFGKILPWFVLWAPISLILSQVLTSPLVPDSDVPVSAHRGSNTSVLITACLGFMWMLDEEDTGITRRQRAILTSVAGLFLVVAGIQNRGGFLAAIAGIAVIYWYARSGQRHFVGIICTVVILIGLIFSVTDIRVSFFSNERDISAQQVVENLVSVVNPDAVATSGDLASNSSWRLDLWNEILRDVNLNAPVLGRGYGVSLGRLYGFEGLGETELRSAHNSHMTIFARSGYLGVGLWFLMWVIWFIAMIRSRRALAARGLKMEAAVAVVAMACALAVLVNAVFDPSIEGPPVSAWIWSVYGLGLGLVLLSRPDRAAPNWELAPGARPGRLEHPTS